MTDQRSPRAAHQLDHELGVALKAAAARVEPAGDPWATNSRRLVRRRRARTATRSLVAAAAAATIAAVVVLVGDVGPGRPGGQEIRPAGMPTAFEPAVSLLFGEYEVAGEIRRIHIVIGKFAPGAGDDWWEPMRKKHPDAFWACWFDDAPGENNVFGQQPECAVANYPPPPSSGPVAEVSFAPSVISWFAITRPDVAELVIGNVPAQMLQPDREVPARFFAARLDMSGGGSLDEVSGVLENGETFGGTRAPMESDVGG